MSFSDRDDDGVGISTDADLLSEGTLWLMMLLRATMLLGIVARSPPSV
jgi:hypothetical protein